MTDLQKQSQTKNASKKIVSLTIDPVLIQRLDCYAAQNHLSRSAAIETAITTLLCPNTAVFAEPPEESIFASPQIGTAIHIQ